MKKILALASVVLATIIIYAADFTPATSNPQAGEVGADLNLRNSYYLNSLNKGLVGVGTNLLRVSLGGASITLTNTSGSYGTNGTAVVFSDGWETNVFMPFTAVGGDGATLPMAVAPMLFDGTGALNRDKGFRSVTNTVAVTPWPSTNGTMYAMPDGIATNALLMFSTPDGVNNSGPLAVLPLMFNGTTLDKDRGIRTIADLTTLLAIYQSIYNTNGYAARSNHIRALNLVVSTNTPTANTNGAGVAGWADEYGQQIIKGFVPANNAINTYPIVDSRTELYGGDGTSIVLNSVTNTQNGTWLDVSRYKHFTYFISPAAATNHWIYCEVSPNGGTNWCRLYTNAITTTNCNVTSFGPVVHKYMRFSYEGTNEACSVSFLAKP